MRVSVLLQPAIGATMALAIQSPYILAALCYGFTDVRLVMTLEVGSLLTPFGIIFTSEALRELMPSPRAERIVIVGAATAGCSLLIDIAEIAGRALS